MDLDFDVKKLSGNVVIAMRGEIDLYSVKQLKDHIAAVMEDEKQPKIILDLEKVNYIDSTGLGILIGIKRRCTEKGGELALVFSSERISKLFTITGLHNVFQISKTVEEAAKKL